MTILRSLLTILFFSFTALRPDATLAGIDRAMAAVFVVRSDDMQETLLGSAFAYGQKGIAVTNAHVVGANPTVILISQDGARQIVRVLASDPLRDVAVLRIAPQHAALAAAVRSPHLGQPVFALGAPFGAGFSLSSGVVSSLARQIEPTVPTRYLQHDAALNPGSSGGPLVDVTGKLIGLNSQIADGFRHFIGISYAIPAAELDKIIENLTSGRMVLAPSLGIRVRPVDARVAMALGLKDRRGVLVDHLETGSTAEMSGLKIGDIILSLADVVLNQPGDLAFAIEAAINNKSPQFTLLRDQQKIQTDLTFVSENALKLGLSQTATTAKKSEYSLNEVGLTVLPHGHIESVEQGSIAHYFGLAAGDQILAINGQQMDASKLPNWVENLTMKGPILLLVRLSDSSTKHYVLDPWHKPGRLMPVGGANVLDTDVVMF